jgi:hypothetical protein
MTKILYLDLARVVKTIVIAKRKNCLNSNFKNLLNF